jgi:hypothetical protein
MIIRTGRTDYLTANVAPLEVADGYTDGTHPSPR